jgi:hypothetical protein
MDAVRLTTRVVFAGLPDNGEAHLGESSAR